MSINRLLSVSITCLLASCAYAKDCKFWMDLTSPDTQGFHYGSRPFTVVQGDLDNDGVTDVAVGTYGVIGVEPGICYILWDGTLYDKIGTTTESSFQLIAIVDLDNNGYKDVVCVSGVFFNQGNRDFVYDKSIRYSLSSQFADLNNDGTIDIVTGAYWRNGSDGTRQDFNIQADYFEIIDMNNDGKLDIIGNKSDITSYYWHENTGDDPLFKDAQIIENTNLIAYKVIDYDYDGDDDLLVKREGIMGFMVNNNGLLPLDFKPLFESIPDGFKSTRIVSDLDQDGDWDLFGYNYDEKRFFVVEQVGYRTLQFEFHWISDKVTFYHWLGFVIYENSGQLYYYFMVSGADTSSWGDIYRTPILVQKENAVSMNWELFQ